MNIHFSMKQEILQDIKGGKEVPWREKRIRTQIVSDSFQRLGEFKKAKLLRYCGTYLEFYRTLENGRLDLFRANFCRQRMCPMCQWRRSIKNICIVSKVLNITLERNPNLVAIFLTRTIKNCKVEDLSKTLDKLFEGDKRFFKNRKVKKIIAGGYFRALEVTYDKDKLITWKKYRRCEKSYDKAGLKPGDLNPSYDTFHPHFHSIILVDRSYFSGHDYLKTEQWSQIWKEALNVSYDVVCDIRLCKKGKGQRKDVVEVAKYTLKDFQIATKDKELTDRLVRELNNALRGRRLVSFGGLMREVARELKVDKLEDGDLVHSDDDSIREDIAYMVERYQWNFGISNYVKI